VLKADGILHKTDVNGVALNIFNNELFIQNYKKLINIDSVTGVIMQPMLTGVELFIGVKKDNNFGHLIMCGLGGIFIETFNDFSSSLTPINRTTALYMIDNLKSKKIFDTYRGQKYIDKNRFIDILLRISKLCEIAPEIVEMDINPLISTGDNIYAVDIRIKIEK
jgi:acetyltransferase